MLASRKRARRFRLLWPLVLTLVALIVVGLGRITDSARSTVDYLSTAQTELARLDGDTTTLRGILSGLALAERSDFTDLMNSLQESLTSATNTIAEEDPGKDLALSAHLLNLSLESWHLGVEDLQRAIITAVDNAEDELAVGRVADALLSLTIGDRIFRDFLRETQIRQTELSLSVALPEVRYGLPTGGAVTSADSLVTSARVSQGMPLRPDLRVVQVMTEPAWETNPDGDLVLPFTAEVIRVSIVIENAGNAIAPAGEVLWSLDPRGEEAVEGRLTTPGLEPSESTTIVIENLAVVAGTRYELGIELTPLENELEIEDNLRNYDFEVNEEP